MTLENFYLFEESPGVCQKNTQPTSTPEQSLYGYVLSKGNL